MYGNLSPFAAGGAGSASVLFAAGMHILGLIVSGTTLLFAGLSAAKLLPRRWRRVLSRGRR
ncbi:hypothetical protein ACU610_07805 [Geodermatophilus sp. URMC 61]|uniref:hypothetical protein n=1 Tax=Geodermatophilus sp. URMC 61 TaxID=3423411 RepID=UPI00406D1D0C